MMNAFRNLYKARNADNAVVAFITAQSEASATEKYIAAGGKCEEVKMERMTHGYDSDCCEIYA
jgi:hypothetical protein